MPPDPVNWWLDPVPNNNNCHFAPRGVGDAWKANGMGCHNPRLDLDNITCNAAETDPDSFEFCAPENVNIDFPPLDQWVRIGVHYYSNHALTYDVHPSVKVFCDGALAAELGPKGYSTPEMPVAFQPKDGQSPMSGNVFWLVGDVLFQKDECHQGCVVQPVYANAAEKSPLLTNDVVAAQTFGPPYPAMP
jgi:hypothetical protein